MGLHPLSGEPRRRSAPRTVRAYLGAYRKGRHDVGAVLAEGDVTGRRHYQE
jgi:hypothetical protein